MCKHHTQRAGTVLHQTAETAFKDQKCHFVLAAFIYSSIIFFFLPNTILFFYLTLKGYSQAFKQHSSLELISWFNGTFFSLSSLLFVFSPYTVAAQVVRLCVLIWVSCKPTNHRTFQAGDNSHGKFLLALCATALTEVVFAQCPAEVLLAG